MDNKKSSSRRVKEGVVSSNKMDKTVTVSVVRRIKDPKYGKVMDRRKKYYAHVEKQKLEIGQKVRIIESRPFSKLKRWCVIEVL